MRRCFLGALIVLSFSVFVRADYLSDELYLGPPFLSCPGYPDITFLSGSCIQSQSIRCVNSSTTQRLQWPYADCTGVPEVVSTFTALPQCAYDGKELLIETCVSGASLTYPVRRPNAVTVVQMRSDKGATCELPPSELLSSTFLIQLDKCIRLVSWMGYSTSLSFAPSTTYRCTDAGLEVTPYQTADCSGPRPGPDAVYTLPLDTCIGKDDPHGSSSGAFYLSCPSPTPASAPSNAGLIVGLVMGGAVLAGAGVFAWVRRGTLFAPRSAESSGALMVAYSALDSSSVPPKV